MIDTKAPTYHLGGLGIGERIRIKTGVDYTLVGTGRLDGEKNEILEAVDGHGQRWPLPTIARLNGTSYFVHLIDAQGSIKP